MHLFFFKNSFTQTTGPALSHGRSFSSKVIASWANKIFIVEEGNNWPFTQDNKLTHTADTHTRMQHDTQTPAKKRNAIQHTTQHAHTIQHTHTQYNTHTHNTTHTPRNRKASQRRFSEDLNAIRASIHSNFLPTCACNPNHKPGLLHVLRIWRAPHPVKLVPLHKLRYDGTRLLGKRLISDPWKC